MGLDDQWRGRAYLVMMLVFIAGTLIPVMRDRFSVDVAGETPDVSGATPSWESTPSSDGDGAYQVYATRIGLVGGTTASGHLVYEDDYFVSLPACTPTNCPNGPTWGRMTDCGTRCYVKVSNPVSGACRVEPVLDLGPWFRVDDWWNPADERYINRLETNSTTLEQGEPASEAARNGVDVGYGRGPNGIGNDDTGSQGIRPVREVGNRAAIDLADGTWRSLHLRSDGTGATVNVEMLWQSGNDPDAQAAACGHPLNQQASTNSPGRPYPSFDGGPVTPAAFDQSENGSDAGAVSDGNPDTLWSTTKKGATEAWFSLDLGKVQPLTGARWKFGRTANADAMTVATSKDGSSWTDAGLFGNADEGAWRGVDLDLDARFVRFSFDNPHGDAILGEISEVEVWSTEGAIATPQSTPAPELIAGSNPDFEGTPLAIVASSASPRTSDPHRAHDGDPGTSWFTTSDGVPGPASITFDLGSVQSLTGIRWSYRLPGGADQMRLQISADGVTWEQLVTTTNRVPATWEGWGVDSRARYVRFVFDNPHASSVLGYLAEIEVWGTPDATPSSSAGGNGHGMLEPQFEHRANSRYHFRHQGTVPTIQ